MLPFSVIDAPSILGLKPTGVETLPEALKNAGLMRDLHATDAGRVNSSSFHAEVDRVTGILNPDAIRAFSLQLADKVAEVRNHQHFPIVLGGDCSILIGCMLALRRAGRYGLFFIDGHADFYVPEVEPTGEVASMELAIVTGRGVNVLTNLDGLKPLVQDTNVVVFGYRDHEEQQRDHSPDIRATSIAAFDLPQIRALGITTALEKGLTHLQNQPPDGFWIHLDADVLDDAIMPAVDYRIPPDGLQFEELTTVLKTLMATEQAVGLTITIFNPKLDPDGSIARNFTRSIVRGLS